MANPVDVTSPSEKPKVESTALPPVQFETARPEAAKVEVAKVEAIKIEAPEVEAPRAEVAKPEAAKPEAVTPAPIKPEAIRPEPARVEAAKPAPAAPKAPAADGARLAAPRLPDAGTLKIAPQPIAAAPAAEPARSARFALLAASVALAAGTGAVLGATGTALVMPAPAAATAQTKPGSDDIRALKESLVRLSSELTAVKASVESAAKTTNGQVAKLSGATEKAIEKAVDKAVDKALDKAVDKAIDKAQAESKATLAKITESLERLEKRPVQAAAAAAPITTAAVAAAPETTGSVPAAPSDASRQAKPQVVEGWIVRDFFDGRALVESRFGTMLEVGPGSSIPGVGRVESVRRQDGRIVVVTQKGVITSFR